MNYGLVINPSDGGFLPMADTIESVPQIPHEGDYRNSHQFENLSRQSGALIFKDDLLTEEFREKAAKWKRDIRGVSSVSEIIIHPSYQWIMAKGTRALRFILLDLQQNGGEWFHALYYIHGRDEAAGAKTVAEATTAWIEWGYKNNHI